jgi:hypothetical protein
MPVAALSSALLSTSPLSSAVISYPANCSSSSFLTAVGQWNCAWSSASLTSTGTVTAMCALVLTSSSCSSPSCCCSSESATEIFAITLMCLKASPSTIGSAPVHALSPGLIEGSRLQSWLVVICCLNRSWKTPLPLSHMLIFSTLSTRFRCYPSL